jgi:uncharacterized protein (UPF0264 family)
MNIKDGKKIIEKKEEDKIIEFSPQLSGKELEYIISGENIQEEIINIINKNTLKIMEEDRREKPAKNLKSIFFNNKKQP